jgi:hypothetical protein
MKKSTKCAALLTSLFVIAAGVNAIFIGIEGGSATKQTQQVERQAPTPLLQAGSLHAGNHALGSPGRV